MAIQNIIRNRLKFELKRSFNCHELFNSRDSDKNIVRCSRFFRIIIIIIILFYDVTISLYSCTLTSRSQECCTTEVSINDIFLFLSRSTKIVVNYVVGVWTVGH